MGGFLDALVIAIKNYPNIKPKGLFRMADFTRWGCAIAEALGESSEIFLKAYENKVKSQIEEAAHASPVATVLLDYLENEILQNNISEWNGTPTELHTALLNHAKPLEISTRQKSWPKAPHSLIRQLNELAPSLKALGWEIVSTKSGERRISIISVQSARSDQTKDPEKVLYGNVDDKDAKDTIISSSSWNRENLGKIKDCLLKEKDENCTIDSSILAEKCKELSLDIHQTIKILLEDGQIFAIPQIGRWGVK